jgi:ribosomal protein L34E
MIQMRIAGSSICRIIRPTTRSLRRIIVRAPGERLERLFTTERSHTLALMLKRNTTTLNPQCAVTGIFAGIFLIRSDSFVWACSG